MSSPTAHAAAAAAFAGSSLPPFTFAPSLEEFDQSQGDLISAKGCIYNHLSVAAVVFNPEGKVLLLQRAATNAFPNQWEIPGGIVDWKEKTVLHAVARELWEETRLCTTHIRSLVASEDLRRPRHSKRACRYSFTVDVDAYDVILDPDEHQSFVWASPEEVHMVQCGHIDLTFVIEEQRDVLLTAFGF